MTAKRMTIVRNGRVLDIKGHRAPPADILIAGDTIAEIGPPGLAAPADAVARRCDRPADPSGPDQRPHPRPRQSEQGDGRPLDARAAADCRALDQRQPHGRGQVSLHLHRRARDADEGLHRLLRPDRRVPAADARGPRRLRQGLRRCRHARGGGADGRQPLLLRGDPRPARRASAGPAEGGRAAAHGALRGEPHGHAAGADGLELRSRAGPARRRPDHPAPLQRRVHARLRRASRASSASACTRTCRSPRSR